jgi:hypothetical protein
VCQLEALFVTYWDGASGEWNTALDTITNSVYKTWRAGKADEQSDIGEYIGELISQLRDATKPMLYVRTPPSVFPRPD